jgi:hypothetical protein
MPYLAAAEANAVSPPAMLRFPSAALVLLALVAAPVHAQHVAASAHAGTRGFGGRLHVRLADRVNVRAGALVLPVSYSGNQDLSGVDFSYRIDLDLLSAGAFVDWFPLGGGFRLSAGAAYNTNTGSGELVPQEGLEIAGRLYTARELGDGRIRVEQASPVAPYVGVGFGNPMARRVSFLVDVGAMYAGSPRVDVTTSGALEPTSLPGPNGEPSAGEQIEQNLSVYRFYPVVTLGLGVRF